MNEIRVRVTKENSLFKDCLGTIIKSTGSGKFIVKVWQTSIPNNNDPDNTEIFLTLYPSETDPC